MFSVRIYFTETDSQINNIAYILWYNAIGIYDNNFNSLRLHLINRPQGKANLAN